MKRPGRITALLLATGIPPLAFTAALFLLGSIPQDIAPYLAVALVLVPMSVFLPLFASVSFRHTARTARQRFERAIPTNCVICGDPLPRSALRQVREVQGPHYESLHPDVWRWAEKRRTRTLPAVLFTLSIIAVVAVFELVTNNYFSFIVWIALFAALVLGWNLFMKRKLRRFRTQWKNLSLTQ